MAPTTCRRFPKWSRGGGFSLTLGHRAAGRRPMRDIDRDMQDFRAAILIGSIQRAYVALVSYMARLRNILVPGVV